MENYLEHALYFLAFVVMGTIVNLSRKKLKKEKITYWRIMEEIFGTLWISLISVAILEEYTNMSNKLIYATASIVGFFHSFAIDTIGKGALQAVSDLIKTKISSKNNE